MRHSDITPTHIAIAAGDGVGPEVTQQAVRVLQLLHAHGCISVRLEEVAYGASAYRATGQVLPAATQASLDACDAILFGATGGPDYAGIPPAVRRQGSLLHIRSRYQLFANLRPVKVFEALRDASSLKPQVVQGVDLLIVRENVGGLYFGEPRGIETLPSGERCGINTQRYTQGEIERVAHEAFTQARQRRGQLCSVTKENVMESGRLWREVVQGLRDTHYPDVTLSHLLADNCAMQLGLRPRQFDVVLADNLLGDILSDCAAVAAGSLGMLPSASLGAVDARGRRKALYEPVHGSAPDIAGQGKANPIGAILSTALLCRHSLQNEVAAGWIEAAVAAVLARGVRTADIAEHHAPCSTAQLGDAVLAELDARCTAGLAQAS